MRSSVIPGDSAHSEALDVQPSGGFESLDFSESELLAIPLHPLGVRPSGNQYTAEKNDRYSIGTLQLLPDEVLAICLEYFDSVQLQMLGSSCKFLYAFCRCEDLWKTLFLE
jgi:hypothetical protein